MIKKEEVILLYNFKDKTELEKLKALLEKLKIKFIVADEKAYQQKVGYLFGLKGFNENEDDGTFRIPYSPEILSDSLRYNG